MVPPRNRPWNGSTSGGPKTGRGITPPPVLGCFRQPLSRPPEAVNRKRSGEQPSGLKTGGGVIALMTDFGAAGWYAACMKAVILTIAPNARLVDITHEIPPQDIVAGAFTLAAAAPWFPPQTIFACVVDPGVGTARSLIAAQADSQTFVGPDNGLCSLVFQRATRLSLVRLTNPRYWLAQISSTFHGRDIIAPVAARLARGCSLRRLGVSRSRYQTLTLPPLQRTATTLRGCILHIDPFGNLITSLPARLIESTRAQVRYQQRLVRVVASYAKGRQGRLVALIGSTGYLELAIPNGSAAKRYRAKRGDRVELMM